MSSRPSERTPVSDGATRRYWLQNAADCSDWNSVSPMNIPIARPRLQHSARALYRHTRHYAVKLHLCSRHVLLKAQTYHNFYRSDTNIAPHSRF